MAANDTSYRQLGQEEEFCEKDGHDKTPPLQSPYLRRNFLASHIFLFGSYVLAMYFVWNRDPSFTACDKKLSTYPPALPHITYQTPKHFNAAIKQSNPYRGPPSPEIDAAWLRIGAGTPGIRLFDEDLKRLNKSTPNEMKPLNRIPEEYGGGYMGMLEVFHLLHCLNGLRKAT